MVSASSRSSMRPFPSSFPWSDSPASISITIHRRAVVELEDVVHLHDVGVLAGARRPRLAQEALRELGAVVLRRLEELEGERLARDGVRRRPDRAHPALAEEPVELVAARDELAGSGLDTHGFRAPR